MSGVSIVTSLYNINRERLDGREWSSYLDWFKKTLAINSPMIVFADEDLREFIETHRQNLPTKIIESKLEDTFYYQYKSKIDSILEDRAYQSKMKNTGRIECKSSLYNIVQYSKFDWVSKAVDINPFNSDSFLWLDAGISRFFDGFIPQIGINQNKFENFGDKLLIQIFMSSYPDLANADILTEDYFWDDRSYVAGGIFLSSKKHIKIVKNLIDEILISKMLGNNTINNEQICLGYLIKKFPEHFALFKNYRNQHRNYEILNFLQNNN